MNKSKRNCKFVISITVFFLLLIGFSTYTIDPYFHYNKPKSDFDYKIYNQRYQNDGILRTFDYDAIITGTSMVENFKTSEFDALFNVKSVKVPYAGANYKEVDESIKRALSYNSDIKIVVRALDLSRIELDKDDMGKAEIPSYLNDDSLLNDINYLNNKEVFFNDTLKTLISYGNGNVTSFDTYSNWTNRTSSGREEVLKLYERKAKIDGDEAVLTDSQRKRIIKNIKQNIIETINENPDVSFYYYIPPYSICWWDNINNKNEIKRSIEVQKLLTESLLPYKNCYLFSFYDDFSMIENLDNYVDDIHYHEGISSLILNEMREKHGLLTIENYLNFYQKIEEYYVEFDYQSFFQ